MSDTHGLEDIIETVYQRHKEETDMFIHCGDSELSQDHPHLKSFKVVAGNVDLFNSGFPYQIVEEVRGLKFLIVHGHQDGVNRSLLNLNYKAENLGAKVICFGHTHIAGAEGYDGKVFINPGSLRSPRDRLERTYAICEWENTEAPFNVSFFTDKGEKMEGLSRSFHF